MPVNKRKNKNLFPLFQISTTTKAAFIVGILMLDVAFLLWRYDAKKLAFNTAPVYPTNFVISPNLYPASIEIKRVKINLPIEQTNIFSGKWEVAKNGASHLISSGVPGKQNIIVIYAHNTKDRFGNIRLLKKEDEIYIKSKDGKIHTYVVDKTFSVKPSEINVLKPQDTEVLTLYTCDGFADSMRFIVQAKPVVES